MGRLNAFIKKVMGSRSKNESRETDMVSTQNSEDREKEMIIGLDVGGTHTDIVLLTNKGVVKEIKVPTDASNLFDTVLTGLEKITAGVDVGLIQRAVLSTTLTTNAIVQGKISPVGMIVTSGPGIDPSFYQTNDHYYAVGGSIDHRGREVDPVNPLEIEKIAGELQNAGISLVGVVGKFSTRNPDHENRIAELLKSRFDKVFLGHKVSGNLNFPRRIATTFLNAVVYPIHKQFYVAVKDSLEKKGMRLPIHILKADGGTMSFEASIDFPGQTLLSGPSASVMGSLPFASDQSDTLVLDIGGTTTDIAVLIKRAPVLEPLGIQIGPYNTLIRSLKTLSIGVGGDSAVRATDGGFSIGPDRVGPAMAYGGDFPTPTDAVFVLGLADNGDRDRAVEGFKTVADAMGVDIQTAAADVFDAACKTILEQARQMIDDINSKPVYTIHELQEGYKVNPVKVLVLGGPAQFFAERLKTLSGYDISVVPKWSVANAIGAGLARTTCEVTLFADTQRGVASAPEEEFSEKITKQYSKELAVQKAFELLKEKAVRIGAAGEDLDFEVLEELQFNMVQGFYTTGRNIRVKVQIKPGVIHRFQQIADFLETETVPLST